MKIVVLGSPDSWHYGDLVRAAAGRHEITAASFADLSSEITGSGVGLSDGGNRLQEADVVIVRSMPAGTLEQIVFRMDALAQLAAAGVRVINPAKAIEAAVDKYLATCRLRDAGLLVPRTFACQTVAAAIQAFEALGGDAVIKPLFGGEGRGVERIQAAAAEPVFAEHEQRGAVVYLQEFIEHQGACETGGRDLRLLVVGERVLGMQRVNENNWRTNISRGGTAEPLEASQTLAVTAKRAADAVGAVVAGVDLLPGRDGRLYAIEVNAVPGWRALSACTGIDVAGLVLDVAADNRD